MDGRTGVDYNFAESLDLRALLAAARLRCAGAEAARIVYPNHEKKIVVYRRVTTRSFIRLRYAGAEAATPALATHQVPRITHRTYEAQQRSDAPPALGSRTTLRGGHVVSRTTIFNDEVV